MEDDAYHVVVFVAHLVYASYVPLYVSNAFALCVAAYSSFFLSSYVFVSLVEVSLFFYPEIPTLEQSLSRDAVVVVVVVLLLVTVAEMSVFSAQRRPSRCHPNRSDEDEEVNLDLCGRTKHQSHVRMHSSKM